MTIRTKTLLILVVTLCSLIGVMYVSSRAILQHSSVKLEEQYTRENVQRARDSIKYAIDGLAQNLLDWSAWDDTYRFVQDRNAAYIRSNIVETTFTGLEINAMLFYDTRQRLVFGEAYDLNRNQQQPVPEDLLAYLAKHPSLLTHRHPATCHKGIIRTAQGELLLVTQPIVDSHAKGPIHGTIVIARRIDPRLVTELNAQSRLSFQLLPYGQLAPMEQRIVSDPHGYQNAVWVMNEGLIRGYAALNDINGKPTLAIRLDRNRSIAERNQLDLGHLTLAIVVIALLCGLLAMILFEKTILSRLSRFQSAVIGVGASGDLSSRVTLEGKDELVVVSDSVNEMLSALEESQTRLRQQEALRESESQYRQLVDLSPDAVFIFIDGRCEFANAAGLDLLLAPELEDLQGRSLHQVVHPDNQPLFLKQINAADAEKRQERYEMRFFRFDGSVVDVEIAVSRLIYQGKPACQVVAHDITERKVSEERLNYLAYHDALTSLPNRLLFKDRLLQAITLAQRRHTQLAVVVLDLDRFKEINDTLGHDMGDRLLQAVANRLRHEMRTSDTVCRVGGDEFFLIFQDIQSYADADHAASRILEKFVEPFVIDGYVNYISPSMGISVFPYDGDTVDLLVKHADLAMYRAKGMGKNTYQFFSAEMSSLLSERHQLETDLRHALDHGELLLHFQPQIDLKTGAIFAFEALCRWQHPKMGMVSPEKFIPVAEEIGLIEQIDEWVLEHACRQLSAWRRDGFDRIRLAINLSGRMFRHRQISNKILHIIDEHGLQPSDLMIEITESVAIEDVNETLNILRRLHELGIHLAIDDFGTGYSSFAYLKKFPIHTLKIDRMFVQDIIDNADDRAIVEGIIALTHTLKIDALAEGIETVAQLEALQAQGCDKGQGFLFSRPVPPEDVPELLSRKLIPGVLALS